MNIIKNKNIKCFIIIIILLLMLTGCNDKNDNNKLEAPQNVNLTLDEHLKWDEVKEAKGYTVSIQKINSVTKTYDVKENEFDVFELLNEIGEYNLYVSAYDDDSKSSNSNSINYIIEDQSNFLTYTLEKSDHYTVIPVENAKLKGKIVIKESINGIPVTEMEEFKNYDGITGVIIPDCITECYGFENCNNLRRIRISPNMKKIYNTFLKECNAIKEVIVPNGVETIIGGAFNYCNLLRKISIGKTVSKINYSSFDGCYDLDEVIIDEDNPYYKYINHYLIEKETERIILGNPSYDIPECARIIGRQAFTNYDAIAELTIPGTIKYIELRAFGNMNLRKVVIEEGVEQIGDAFSGNKLLKEVSLPSTLTYLGKDNFHSSNQMEKIVFPNGNDYYEVRNNCLIDKEEKKIIFAYGKNVTIPDDIKIIGYSAFEDSLISEIIIPATIEKIETRAFHSCPNLTKVVMQEGLKEIGWYAFAESYNIKSITIPRSVNKIDEAAFYMCYCPVILHNSSELIASSGAFSRTTVYTDMDFDEYMEKYYDDNMSSDVFGNCSACFNCTFVDDYLYSYQYKDMQFTQRTKHKNFKYGGYYKEGFISLAIADIVEVPYREGYEFLGFSFEEGSTKVDVGVDYRYHLYNDYTGEKREFVKRYCYAISFPNDLENGQILYAIWKKIE